MYGKLFKSTYEGSMVGTGFRTFAIWAYIISNADADGIVTLNPAIMATVFGESKDDVKQVIEHLCSPDPDSRNPDEDGKRLVKEDGFSYRIVNYLTYREIMSDLDRREGARLRKERQRAREAWERQKARQP
jgi:hypothetical protein